MITPPLGPELWLPVVSNDRYIVSELGRVARLLRPAPTNKGYLKVSLCHGDRTPPDQPYVHQLVMAALAGPCPPGFNVDHLDFTRDNNTRSNLRYMLKAHNDWRWKRYEENASPTELADIDARYAAWEAEACAAVARGDADPFDTERAAAS